MNTNSKWRLAQIKWQLELSMAERIDEDEEMPSEIIEKIAELYSLIEKAGIK